MGSKKRRKAQETYEHVRKRKSWQSTLHWYERNGYLVNWQEQKPVHMVEYSRFYGSYPKGWVIHHINHDKRDNSKENLMALPKIVHGWAHEGVEARLYIKREQLEKWVAEVKDKPSHWRDVEHLYDRLPLETLEKHAQMLLKFIETKRKGQDAQRKRILVPLPKKPERPTESDIEILRKEIADIERDTRIQRIQRLPLWRQRQLSKFT